MNSHPTLPVAVIGAGPVGLAAAAHLAGDGCACGTSDKPEQIAEAPPAKEGCCGGAPKRDAAACCALDEEKKLAGEAGCGCGSKTADPVPANTT